ncbi:hypothetical protein ACOMHN_040249 [Nucella lapillus]
MTIDFDKYEDRRHKICDRLQTAETVITDDKTPISDDKKCACKRTLGTFHTSVAASSASPMAVNAPHLHPHHKAVSWDLSPEGETPRQLPPPSGRESAVPPLNLTALQTQGGGASPSVSRHPSTLTRTRDTSRTPVTITLNEATPRNSVSEDKDMLDLSAGESGGSLSPHRTPRATPENSASRGKAWRTPTPLLAETLARVTSTISPRRTWGLQAPETRPTTLRGPHGRPAPPAPPPPPDPEGHSVPRKWKWSWRTRPEVGAPLPFWRWTLLWPGGGGGGRSSTTLSSATEASDDNGDGNFHVVLRVRPLSTQEKQRRDQFGASFPGDGQCATVCRQVDSNGSQRHFQFNVVFEPDAVQEDVFENCGIRKLVDSAVMGYTCTAFAFGQTGSGKTHTMTGPPSQSFDPKNRRIRQAERTVLNGAVPPDIPSTVYVEFHQVGVTPDPKMYGIIQRSFKYLFQQIKQQGGGKVIRASYLEIYNEQVIDLLNNSHRRYLSVRWSKNKGFYVENLFTVECETLDDLMAVLEEGRSTHCPGTLASITAAAGWSTQRCPWTLALIINIAAVS